MIRLALAGATGRMGRCVLELAARDARFSIAAALTAPGCSMSGQTVSAGEGDVPIEERLEAHCDVLVDFSVPAGTMAWLEACEARRMPMVIGVTGHDAEQRERVERAASRIPIVLAANFSAGISVVLGLLGPLMRTLGEGYDVEIVETHHRQKVDAPSGTALAMVEELHRVLGIPSGDGSTDRVVFGRQGKTGARPEGQIAVHAVRMGDVVGQHEIHISGCGETLTIRHTAHSRETFARGALRAAEWVVGRPAGLYGMREVLRLEG